MVVGKHEPKSAATSVPTPLTTIAGRIAKLSPAASADSMFWSDPTTLNSPIGTMIERYATHCPPRSAAIRSPTTGIGR